MPDTERHHPPPAVEHDNPAVEHEASDVNVRAILLSAAALIIIAAVVQLLVWVLLQFFVSERAKLDPEVPPLALPSGQLPPEPRLQTRPREDLQALRTEEDAALAGESGGTPTEGGVYRISIERAKTLLLERGLPTRAAPSPSGSPGATASLQDSSSGRLPPATRSRTPQVKQ